MAADWMEIKARGLGRKKERAVSILIKAGSPGVLEWVEEPACLIERESRWWEEGEGGGGGGRGGVNIEKRSAVKFTSFTAYLRDSTPQKLNALKRDLKRVGWSFTASSYRERDWARAWASGIRPVRVSEGGASIVVRTSWAKVRRRRGDLVVEIDPGMAFGTGSHETTRMCLKAILSLMRGSRRTYRDLSFLDVGTGTGVLAIAAKKLGAAPAVANDIDRVALGAARKNARKNNVSVRFTGNPVERIKGSFSIVAANILLGESIRLASYLKERLLPGGYLILSGLLKEQREGVIEAYSGLGLEFYKGYSIGEWRTVVFKRGEDP